jgi:hypothetical protein
MAGKGLELFDKELKMVGENTLIINQDEMVRAMNKYFNDLILSSDRGNARVISVRQKGAHLENVFIIEIADKPKQA